MVVHDVEEIAGPQTPYGGGTMVVQRVSAPPPPFCPSLPCPSSAPALAPFPSFLQTPEEERSLLHADSNGYTNLPDVVQPSHSPTESSKGQSPPLKDGGSDVSGWRWLHGARRGHWPWAGSPGALGEPWGAGWPGRNRRGGSGLGSGMFASLPPPPHSTSLVGW